MEIVQAFLKSHSGINFIRYEWLDYFNVLRTRVLTTEHVLNLLATSTTLTVQSAALQCPYIGTPERAPAAGTCALHPDWSSISIYACHPGHAAVLCWAHDGASGTGFEGCPRSALARCLRTATTRDHLSFLVGFEVEIVLIDSLSDLTVPVKNTAAWSSAASLRNKYHAVVEEIVLLLRSSGLLVEQYHTEGAQGMFEIVMKALPPLQAVDCLLRTQETIKSVCIRKNLIATMSPKPTTQPNNAGQHIHLSINPPKDEENFLAGILENLPAICAFTMPSYDSYTRVKDLGGTIGTWVSWGLQLRDVPVRKIESGHWEFRSADGTANMYLALNAIIACGLWGKQQKLPLKWQDPGITPCRLDGTARKSLGITQLMPRCLKEALDELKHSRLMVKILDREIISRFIRLKDAEETLASTLSEEERRMTCIELF